MKKKEEDKALQSVIEGLIGQSIEEVAVKLADKINQGIPLDDFPWNDFVTFLEMTIKVKKTSIFLLLRDTLFLVHSYSKRISCIPHLKNAAYSSAKPEYLQDWEFACSVLTNYYSRLRELTSNGHSISRKWGDELTPMDELSFLLEHINADELIVLMQLTPGFMATAKPLPAYEEVIADMSRIFGMKSFADVGTYAMPTLCIRLQAVNMIRLAYMNGRPFGEIPSNSQIEIPLRNQCFDIYIDQRIKIIRDELLAADDTLPTIPSDTECLLHMLDADKALYGRMERIIDAAMANKNDTIQRMDQRIVETISEEYAEKWATAVHNSMPLALKLMKSLVRYEETKIAQLQKAESFNGARSMTFNAPVGQVIANVEELNTTQDGK